MIRLLLLLLLSFSVGLTACSSKKSSTSTAPATNNTDTDTDDDDDTTNPGSCSSGSCPVVTIPGMPKPQNGQYYVGKVKNITQSNYKKFLKAGLGVYSDGGQFGDGYNYNWNYTCDINVFSLIFDGELFNCQNQQSQFQQYINAMAAAPAMITLSFYSNGHVEGNWLVDAYQDFYGYIDYYMGIPFQGSVVKLNDGRYLIEAGPLSLVTSTPTSKTTFNAYFFDGSTDLPIGVVTVK